jgi:TIR domain
MSKRPRGGALPQLIDRCLREGACIEIDGLGSFRLNSKEEVLFQPSGRSRVFLAYALEDRVKVRRLCAALRKAGFEPWMDEEKLLPGQNWPRAIERAIALSDFFVSCFSRRSVAKRGHFQAELAYALDIARRVPQEKTFLIPVRLDDCEVPRIVAATLQYVDVFPAWDRGVKKLCRALWQPQRG